MRIRCSGNGVKLILMYKKVTDQMGGKKENGEVTPRALILQVSGDLLKKLSAVLQIDIHSVVG